MTGGYTSHYTTTDLVVTPRHPPRSPPTARPHTPVRPPAAHLTPARARPPSRAALHQSAPHTVARRDVFARGAGLAAAHGGSHSPAPRAEGADPPSCLPFSGTHHGRWRAARHRLAGHRHPLRGCTLCGGARPHRHEPRHAQQQLAGLAGEGVACGAACATHTDVCPGVRCATPGGCIPSHPPARAHLHG